MMPITKSESKQQEADYRGLRLGSRSNVAIIKIESDTGSPSSQCTSKVTINPPTSDKPTLSARKNFRSHSVKIDCNRENRNRKSSLPHHLHKRDLKKSTIDFNKIENSKDLRGHPNTNENVTEESRAISVEKVETSDNIVRRSNSVVIQCNSKDQTFPLPLSSTNNVLSDFKVQKNICNNQVASDGDIHENLRDVKHEIEKLITEREALIRENLLLGYYKKSFDKLKQENINLREEIKKLLEVSESGDDNSDDHDDSRYSPDGQDSLSNISKSSIREE